jgi:hypothetical protein
MEFASIEDRDYFVEEDPVQLALKPSLGKMKGTVVDDLYVADFTPGEY